MTSEEAQTAYEAAMAATDAVITRLAREGLDDSEIVDHEDYRAAGKLEFIAYNDWEASIKSAVRHTLGGTDDHSE